VLITLSDILNNKPPELIPSDLVASSRSSRKKVFVPLNPNCSFERTEHAVGWDFSVRISNHLLIPFP
jgi:hypothetical protein